jgi:hypothetical protein
MKQGCLPGETWTIISFDNKIRKTWDTNGLMTDMQATNEEHELMKSKTEE